MPPMISVSPKSLGVNTAATPSSRSRRPSESGMIPPTIDRHVLEPGLPQPVEHARDQLHVGAGQDREPDAVDVLGDGRRDDLLRA